MKRKKRACGDCHRLFLCFTHPVDPLGHRPLQQSKGAHKHREQVDAHLLGQQTEQRRHKGGAAIGKGHLDAHDGVAVFPTEVGGGSVDDGGVYRGATQSQHQQTRQGGVHVGDKEQHKTGGLDTQTHPDHGLIAKAIRYKAVEQTSHRHTQSAQQGKGGGGGLVHTVVIHQIATGPQGGGGFQRAIAEKGEKRRLDAPDFQRSADADGSLVVFAVFIGGVAPLFP